MSEATSGACLPISPACRYAHAGYLKLIASDPAQDVNRPFMPAAQGMAAVRPLPAPWQSIFRVLEQPPGKEKAGHWEAECLWRHRVRRNRLSSMARGSIGS